MKKIKYILLLILLLPVSVFALDESYSDIVAEYSNTEVKEDVVNVYFFHGDGCPHCKKADEYFKKLKKDYKDKIEIIPLEVWNNETNLSIMYTLYNKLGVHGDGVPFIVIGDDYTLGFDDSGVIENEIKNKIDFALYGEKSYMIHLPIIGDVDKRKVSLPVVAIVLGFIDGFNPCAMWILLFLINLFINSNKLKKSWILGIVFLLTSGLVYFLSMFGISTIISVTASDILKKILAIFIIGAGIYNMYNYIKSLKKDTGCTVVDKNKRKKIMNKINDILAKKSFVLSVIGIMSLAISVNLIELACSIGFPVVFTSLLAFNNVTGFLKVLYLIIYIIFYMLDDIVVFTISMFTLNATGITNKYNKACKLISAIIMITIGILLLVKPELLLFG